MFHGLEKPLCLATFTKERVRKLVGLAFYLETAAWHRMPPRYHAILERARTNVWVEAIFEALKQLGGSGTVDQIAGIITGRAAYRHALSPTRDPQVAPALVRANGAGNVPNSGLPGGIRTIFR